MAFEVIETQEQLDGIIADRLRRERETTAKKYADYDEIKQKVSDYEKQIGEMTKAADENAKKYSAYDTKFAEMQSKIKGYETNSVKMRIAHEKGIPYELAERLSGDNEDDIRKDAETLAKFVSRGGTAPLKSSEGANSDTKTEALRAFTAKLVNND